MNRQGQAVVLGASIAGLFAGRVLADHFDKVVVIDKEGLDGGAEPRQAVPQGNHIHVILPPTHAALMRFAPEILEQLVENGGHLYDAGEGLRMYFGGVRSAEGYTGQTLIGSTRPFFEKHLRDHVGGLGNVEIRPNSRFNSWITDNERERVTGITISSGSGTEEVRADLVIDTRGRASALPRELEDLGYEAPDIEKVRIGLGYTSRLFTYDGPEPEWKALFINPTPPDHLTGAAVEKIENGKYIVTMFGYFGNHAADNEEGFMEYARNIQAPDIAEFLDVAKPVSDFKTFATPETRFTHYEKLETFPDRLLAMGDTVCGLNPIYGQGMTKAAREAVFLADQLEQHFGSSDSLEGFSDTFRAGLPNAGAGWAWGLTKGADFGYPQTEGEMPDRQGFMNWYMGRIFKRATTSLDARRRLFDVTMLVEDPSTLFKPRMILHALGI